MNLLDLAAEANATALPEAVEMANPVITKKKFGSKRKLYPFADEDLEGYRMPGSSKRNIRIVCGHASLEADKMTVHNSKQADTFLVPDIIQEKICHLVPDVTITAIVSDGVCLDLKLGPFFGVSSWKLFYGDNKKSATAFYVR